MVAPAGQEPSVNICSECGRPLKTDTAALLRQWCRENGHHITADDSVYEPTAAILLDRAPNTLSNWRANGGGSVPFMRPGGRIRYRITDLADYIDATRVTE